MLMQREPGAHGTGTTLSELQAIAQEVGVDPDLVTAAAHQLATGPEGIIEHLLGGEVRRDIRLVHEGPMSPTAMQALVMTIRSAMQHQGTTREVLGALEWSSVGQPSQVAVTARTEDDRTVVQVVADRSAAANLTVVGSVGLGVFAAAITGAIVEPAALGGIALMGSGVVAGAGLARAVWQRTSRNFQKKLERLTSAIRQGFDS